MGSAHRRTTLLVGIGALVWSVDAGVVAIALSSIQKDLHVSVADVQWVATAFLLAVATTIPVSGWAARALGTRTVYLAAVAVFACGSALCVASQSLTMLIFARVVQGFAAGLLYPVSQMILADIGGPDLMGRALSRMWVFSTVGTTLGPTLGGAAIGVAGDWRSVFVIDLVLGLGVLTVATRVLPPASPAGNQRLDVPGLIQLAFALPALFFGLSNVGSGAPHEARDALFPTLLGAALLVAFVRRSLRRPNPVLDLRLYRRPRFAASALCIFTTNTVWFGLLLLLPLYFQHVLRVAPVTAAFMLAPLSLGAALGLFAAGRVDEARASSRVGLSGAIVAAVGAAVLGAAVVSRSQLELAPLIGLLGFALGLATVPAFATAYRGLRLSEVTHASPLVSVVARVSGSVGAAATAIVLQHELIGARSHGVSAGGAYSATLWWLAAFGAVGVLSYAFLVCLESASVRTAVA